MASTYYSMQNSTLFFHIFDHFACYIYVDTVTWEHVKDISRSYIRLVASFLRYICILYKYVFFILINN